MTRLERVCRAVALFASLASVVLAAFLGGVELLLALVIGALVIGGLAASS